ncbi:hypothetical protein AYO41_00070 [Verrucomicrobia bacterium SCGC AG-212-E04]|nr:hypothetical protein AYO41_00070 [Verrucomicrobia bacterium SCGC AG-212-E04]
MLFARSVLEIDAYVLDVLLPDLVGHDKQPSAFIVYVFLYGCAERARWRPVTASLRDLATRTALSKSAIQAALENLRRRELIRTKSVHPTAAPMHSVLRPWRARWRKNPVRKNGLKSVPAIRRRA